MDKQLIIKRGGIAANERLRQFRLGIRMNDWVRKLSRLHRHTDNLIGCMENVLKIALVATTVRHDIPNRKDMSCGVRSDSHKQMIAETIKAKARPARGTYSLTCMQVTAR